MTLHARDAAIAAKISATRDNPRLPGIPLKPLHSQPREIPYDGDRLCLELDRKSEHWSRLQTAPGFVLGVSGKLEREPEIEALDLRPIARDAALDLRAAAPARNGRRGRSCRHWRPGC